MAEGVLEYSTDGTSWQVDRLTGEQTKELTQFQLATSCSCCKNINLWWRRIADFSVETRAVNSEMTDTNVESLIPTPNMTVSVVACANSK